MKKVLLLLSIFIINSISFGQKTVGIKGGTNLSKLSGSNSQFRLGLYSGAFFKKNISKLLFIQPELLYSSKGYTHEPPSSSSKGSVRLNYISLPINIGIQANEKFSILIGPELDYLVRHVSHNNNEAGSFVWKKYGYPRFDCGIISSINYQFSKSISAELRYNYGFNTLYWTDAAGVKHDETKQANRAIQLGVNYFLK